MDKILCALYAFFMMQAAPPTKGEVIDRIVAIVNKQIITLSDIRAERKMREVLGEPTPESDSELLEELIDINLIHSQVDQFPGIDPTDVEIDSRLAEIKDYRGLPRGTVREAVRERLQRELFVDAKFRQVTTATEKETKDYYENIFLPEARSRGLNPLPSQQDVQTMIERNIVEEKVASQLKTWLQQMRKTTPIEILPETSVPPDGVK